MLIFLYKKCSVTTKRLFLVQFLVYYWYKIPPLIDSLWKTEKAESKARWLEADFSYPPFFRFPPKLFQKLPPETFFSASSAWSADCFIYHITKRNNFIDSKGFP